MAFEDDSLLNEDLFGDIFSDDSDENSAGTVGLEDPELLTSQDDDFDDDSFETTDKSFKKLTKSEEFEQDLEEPDPSQNEDLISQLLKSKGIEDYTKIQFENENGEIEYFNFYDLSPEEQLAILNSNDADINYGLSEQEVEVINLLRSNNITFEEAIDYYKREAIEEYLRDNVSETFSVDKMSNEELFILDLKSKFEDLTEEELDIELQKELTQPELFEKKMNRLRQSYLEVEAQKIEFDNEEQLRKEQQDFDTLVGSLVETATKIDDLGGLDLTEDDKNEVLDFILNKDVNGVSPLVKSLNNYDNLFKMAWFIVKGDEAFNILHDYYKNEIEKVRKTTLASVQKQNENRSAVFKPETKPGNRNNRPTSIDDLY
jgi:hypothetical protein